MYILKSVNMGILKRLVVYVQINNFFEYYKMDRKILILGITLTVVILFLSFRKEGYEEELKDWQTQNETIEVPYKMYTKRMIIQIKKG